MTNVEIIIQIDVDVAEAQAKLDAFLDSMDMKLTV